MAWTWANIDWDKTLSVLVALATLIQAGMAIVMARGLKHAAASADAASKAVAIAEDTAERQLRAYLDVHTVEISGWSYGYPTRLEIRIDNNGQTRASEVRGLTRWMIVTPEESLTVAPPVPGVSHPTTTIGAGRDLMWPLSIPEADWAPRLDRVRSGELVLLALGTIEYMDVFGRQRRTVFRRQYKPEIHELKFVSHYVADEAT